LPPFLEDTGNNESYHDGLRERAGRPLPTKRLPSPSGQKERKVLFTADTTATMKITGRLRTRLNFWITNKRLDTYKGKSKFFLKTAQLRIDFGVSPSRISSINQAENNSSKQHQIYSSVVW
jgi:hypothetical protein